jgi:hypothetical protein
MMKPAALGLLLGLGPMTAALAEPAWLSADEFDARVTGNATRLIDQYGNLFGTEYFLPGRKVIWQFADDTVCYTGVWAAEREAVCYFYDDGDSNCLRYYPEGKGLTGVEWADGAPFGSTYQLQILDAPVPSCTAPTS